MQRGLAKVAQLAPGGGYVEASAGVHISRWEPPRWEAQAEAGLRLGANQRLFARGFASPNDVGVMGGYRFEW